MLNTVSLPALIGGLVIMDENSKPSTFSYKLELNASELALLFLIFSYDKL